MKKILFLTLSLFFLSCEKSNTGFINIKSTPQGANVYIEDDDIGEKTDVVLSDIVEGIYRLKLILTGYKEWSRDIEVKAGETTYVEATLEQSSSGNTLSIIVVEDTVFTTSDTTGLHEFPFYLKNESKEVVSATLNLITDIPGSLWYASLCDSNNCYPLPHDVDVSPDDSVFFNVTIGFGSSGEGKATLNVGCIWQNLSKTFIVKAGQ